MGAAPNNPVSLIISKAYLRWEINRPFLEEDTSMPRKYF